MDRELKLWIGGAVLTVVFAVVGTGVAVGTLVVGNVNMQISDVRADMRQIRDSVQDVRVSVDRLDARLDDIEKAIAGMQVKIDLLLPESGAD